MELNIKIHNIISPNKFILSYKIGGTINCQTSENDGFIIYRKDNSDGIYPSSLDRDYGVDPINIKDIGFTNLFLKTFYIKITDVLTSDYKIDMLKVDGFGLHLNCSTDNVCDFINDIKPTPTPTIVIITPTLTSTVTIKPSLTIETIIFGGLTFNTTAKDFSLLVNEKIYPYELLDNNRYFSELNVSGKVSLQIIENSILSDIQYVNVTLFNETTTPIVTPTPTVTIPPVLPTQPISNGFVIVNTNKFNNMPDSPEYYLDSVGNGSTTKYDTIQTPIGFDYYSMSGTRVPYESSRFGLLVNWTQKLVAIQGSENNIVKEGNKTYYFRPPNYQTNTSYNMYDFHLTFPEFTPIQGKLVSIQPVPFQEELQAEMIKRGVTHVRRGVPNSNRIVFFMDDWLNDVRDVNGNTMYLPPAYQGLESDRQYFYEMLDPYQMAQQLYAQFKLNNLLEIGLVFWNYERINSWGDSIGTWGNVQPRPEDIGKPKKQIFFEQFSLLKPSNNLFVAWAHKPIVLTPGWGNENYQVAWDAVYNKTVTTPQQLDSVYAANNLTPRTFPNGVNSFSAMDIFHVGFYQVGIKEYQEFLYKHIFEAYFNKKMYPNKKVVGTLWTDNETLVTTDVNVQTNPLTYYGLTKNVSTKPAASFTYMQSFAAWMTAIADGFDIWEYREFLENQSTWERIDQPQFDYQPPHYPYKSFKGVDWAMSSVYSLKQNEDILLANTEWVFPISPWVAAGGFFHASTKHPLIAYKLSSNGTEALVLAVDSFNEDMVPKSLNVSINGQNQEIKIIYKFTSIVRIQL